MEFVHVSGVWFAPGSEGRPHREEVCVDAHPGRQVNVNMRPGGSPVWRDTLLLRDWLRKSAAGRAVRNEISSPSPCGSAASRYSSSAVVPRLVTVSATGTEQPAFQANVKTPMYGFPSFTFGGIVALLAGASLPAEGEGFEPSVSFPTHAFQACRFGRSRTPPGVSHARRRVGDGSGRALLLSARGPC